MRGALRGNVGNKHVQGIIPAYAGSTTPRMPQIVGAEDHPRVCGEHVRRGQQRPREEGSSPRMRGAQIVIKFGLGIVGIIPAYAGSTNALRDAADNRRDHPRVCGEHSVKASGIIGCMGSSPRMRGAPRFTPSDALRVGIIPAYAGSTKGSPHESRGWRDHPRVCGEHSRTNIVRRFSVGSSPRMRGALHRRSGWRGGSGIIPAYAGSTNATYSVRGM